MITRRDFLKIALLTPFALESLPEKLYADAKPQIKEALYYQKLNDKKMTVSCQLCPRGCTIPEGETGFCRARKNIKGTLFSLGYAQPCAIHIDPIEKKPFYNFYPKSMSFSIASAGCNLRCKFCQNWQISQVSPLDTVNQYSPPDKIVSTAKSSGCRSIAYTYTEPTNFFEYMFDTAKLARSNGVLNVNHSNGYINPEPLKELCKYLDAANIDLKGFSNDYYNKICEAELNPVLETIKTLKKSGVWVEITNLVIPGYNDDTKMITKLCEWVKNDVGADTPVHFSRFYPMYKMTGVAPTPVSTLEKAREIAIKTGLHYPYVGNVPGHSGDNTYCPNCKKMLVKRAGYSILENAVKNGKCKYCGAKIGGVWG
jgi:pyruvate formate lyase activating enzyme